MKTQSEPTLSDVLAAVERIERHLIVQSEYRSCGHRLVHNKAGVDQLGGRCDPALLDEHGFQVRLP